MTDRWEYKVVTFEPGWKGYDYAKFETELNELGAQGWEAIMNLEPSVGAGWTAKVGIVLKRSTTPTL